MQTYKKKKKKEKPCQTWWRAFRAVKLQNQLSIIYIQLKKQKEKNTNFFSLGNKKQGNNDKEEQ